MQIRKKVFLCSIVFLAFISCEDVIEVTTPDVATRLVLDAVIRVAEENSVTNVTVYATETSNFFESSLPAELTEIKIINTSTGVALALSETEMGSGIYSRPISTTFLTQSNMQLRVVYNNEIYTASANYTATLPINSIEQGSESLFADDQTEVIVSFNDDPGTDNFYVFDFSFGNFLVTEDEFYQGQEFDFSYFYDNELVVGETTSISILGASQDFYRYMDRIIQLSTSDTGPFSTPVGTVRGNIINETTPNTPNFALGYFAICQTYSETITITEN